MEPFDDFAMGNDRPIRGIDPADQCVVAQPCLVHCLGNSHRLTVAEPRGKELA